MAQLLQADIRHCGTSAALWVRGHLMVGITRCVFKSQRLFCCNLISRGWVIPKSPESIQTVHSKMHSWTSVFNKTVEKVAGNFVEQILFSYCLQPSGLQRPCVLEPATTARARWWIGDKWLCQTTQDLWWDIWVDKINIQRKTDEIDLLNKVPVQLPTPHSVLHGHKKKENE